MDMGMVQQVLAPGVQHGQKSDFGTQVPSVSGDLLQGL
jgi:hypothetical protein